MSLKPKIRYVGWPTRLHLTGDDRATILGALIWMADKLRSDERDKAIALWAEKGKSAFEAEHSAGAHNKPQPQLDGA